MDGSKDEVVGHLEYRADLFEPATAHRFVKHLQVSRHALPLRPLQLSKLALRSEPS